MTYRSLLKNYPTFRRFWIVFVLMDVGAWFSSVALYTLLTRFDATALVIATIAALHWIPGAIQAPITGAIVDKVHPKKLMLTLILVEVVTTAGFLLVQSPSLIPLLMILVFVRMSAVSFYFTAFQASLPLIVGKGEPLRRANELGSLSWSLSFIAGTALGALSVNKLGTNFSFMVDVVIIFAGWLILLGVDLPQRATKVTQSAIMLLKDGVVYIRTKRKLILFILLHATVGFTNFDALVTLLAQHQYAAIVAVPVAIGAINTVRAVGMFFGPFIFRHFNDEKKLVYWLLMGQGVGVLLWASLQGNFYISMIGVFVSGLFTASLWAATYSMLLYYTDEKMLGRVVSYNDMTFMLTNALTAVLIGVLASIGASLSLVTALIGATFVVVAISYKIFWLSPRKNP